MDWSEHVLEMNFPYLRLHIIVGFSPPLFQSFLEWKLCHNSYYDIWLLLLYFHKDHMCIWMECYAIFQLGHSDGILRGCHAGYMIFFRLKLYSWRTAHSWDFIWAFWLHVFLDCMGCYTFRLGPAQDGPFSTLALIWVHFKTVHYFPQPIISLFSYLKMQYII